MQNDISWGAIGVFVGGIVTGLFAWLVQKSKGGTETEIAVIQQWEKFAHAVSERLEKAEAGEERCREQLADVQSRLSALEGYEFGKGKARQDAANIVAVERLADNDKSAGEK